MMDSPKKQKKNARYFAGDASQTGSNSDQNTTLKGNKLGEKIAQSAKMKKSKQKAKHSDNTVEQKSLDFIKLSEKEKTISSKSEGKSDAERNPKFPSERFGKNKKSLKNSKKNSTQLKQGKDTKKNIKGINRDIKRDTTILKRIKKKKEREPVPISKEKLRKYKRGHKVHVETVVTNYHKVKLKQGEKAIKKAVTQSARSELLLHEDAGFVEADEGEMTCEVSQYEIANSTDITSATKFFNLTLNQFGPYCMNYSRNGRHLLLGGAKGHVAAIDWQTKKLMCEINVMETIKDIKWLHIETMFAVAQKQWVYVYDNQGLELHCLKTLDNVLQMEFLPYHFLLSAGNAKGYLQWLDVSVGKKVAGYFTNKGRLDVMCQNPRNAIIHCGHTNGTVTLWSPNVKKPLVTMLCHKGATRAVAVHQDGNYMATSSIDRNIRIWDLRQLKPLYATSVGTGPSSLSFSQRGLLAASLGNTVEVYRDVCKTPIVETYLNHRLEGSVKNVQFCPYEDVLGVGYDRGFASLLVPGAGEPNFDAFEANPFQTKTQRREMEVKMLLDKVQPDLIHMDTSALGHVDAATVQEQIEKQASLLELKPKKIDFRPRYRAKGRSNTGNFEKRKIGVRMERKMGIIRKFNENKDNYKKQLQQDEKGTISKKEGYNVFNRFSKSNV